MLMISEMTSGIVNVLDFYFNFVSVKLQIIY